MAGGGESLRIRLTNRYGRIPMTIATAATEHGRAALIFNGAEKLTIPPGEESAGDPWAGRQERAAVRGEVTGEVGAARGGGGGRRGWACAAGA
jgi:hypothetical protein